MKEKKVVYYEDELNDEFSKAKIEPRVIDENYCYHHNAFWDILSFFVQNILSMPVKKIYGFLKFRIKYVGKEKLKECKDRGYFIYVNHTQEFGDTFIPSLANFPKRNFFIVNPENISMKGLKHLVELLGAIPIPGNYHASKKFLNEIKSRILKHSSITIYPEAHIWPYYTKIRPFKDISFKYPIDFNTQVFCITNTYHQRKNGKVKIISYIDGPFYPNKELSLKEQRKDLRDQVYNKMVERSKSNSYEYILYKKKQ